MRNISLWLISSGAIASTAAAVSELRRVDDQWGLTGELTMENLSVVLVFVLMPYLLLMVGALLARNKWVQWVIFFAITVILAVSGFIEIPRAWEPWDPNDPSYIVGAILKYPLACLSLVIGFISFDIHRLSAEDL